MLLDFTVMAARTAILTNSQGEDTGRMTIPPEVEVWYGSLYSPFETNGYLPYLTYRDGGYFLDGIIELGRTSNDDLDDLGWLPEAFGGLSDGEQMEMHRRSARSVAEAIAPSADLTAAFGEATGVFGRSELAVSAAYPAATPEAVMAHLSAAKGVSFYGE